MPYIFIYRTIVYRRSHIILVTLHAISPFIVSLYNFMYWHCMFGIFFFLLLIIVQYFSLRNPHGPTCSGSSSQPPRTFGFNFVWSSQRNLFVPVKVLLIILSYYSRLWTVIYLCVSVFAVPQCLFISNNFIWTKWYMIAL